MGLVYLFPHSFSRLLSLNGERKGEKKERKEKKHDRDSTTESIENRFIRFEIIHRDYIGRFVRSTKRFRKVNGVFGLPSFSQNH